ncbi:hypothetical protein [Sinorhizobium medicae]
MTRSIETCCLTWRNLVIEISYEECWLGTDGPFSTAHLEVRSAARTPLPITETGYRSHFTSASEIEEAGGPVAFVQAWLDRAAQSTAWKTHEETARQMTLF